MSPASGQPASGQPASGQPASGQPLVEFVAVMRRLRAECPWKAQQTHASLSRYLIEELHETLEAIDLGDAEHLCEELGDLLLQVYFHAAIAEEAGRFTLDDVARGIIDKMRRRNPHVFGDPGDPAGPADPADPADAAGPLDAAAVNDAWQAIKAREKGRDSVLDGLPPGLPALLHADKVVDRLRREGVEVAARADGDLGDRLLALVLEANAQGVDPERALREAVRRVVPRDPAL